MMVPQGAAGCEVEGFADAADPGDPTKACDSHSESV